MMIYNETDTQHTHYTIQHMRCFPQEIWLCIHEQSDDPLTRRRLEKALGWPVMGIQKIPPGKFCDYWTYRRDHSIINNVDQLFIPIETPPPRSDCYYTISLVPHHEVTYLPWHKDPVSGKWNLSMSLYYPALTNLTSDKVTHRTYTPTYSSKILMEHWAHCSRQPGGDDDGDDDGDGIYYYEQYRDVRLNMPVAEYIGSFYEGENGKVSFHLSRKRKRKKPIPSLATR